jgi:hypothetical protein
VNKIKISDFAATQTTTQQDGQHGAVPRTLQRGGISFDPSSISEKVGSVFSVHVVVNNAQNVSSVPLQLLHDPKMVQRAGVAAGDLLGSWGTVEHREDTKRGRIDLTVSSDPRISGSGTICRLFFVALEPGQSKLSFSQAALRDAAMKSISVESSTATVTVTR